MIIGKSRTNQPVESDNINTVIETKVEEMKVDGKLSGVINLILTKEVESDTTTLTFSSSDYDISIFDNKKYSLLFVKVYAEIDGTTFFEGLVYGREGETTNIGFNYDDGLVEYLQWKVTGTPKELQIKLRDIDNDNYTFTEGDEYSLDITPII